MTVKSFGTGVSGYLDPEGRSYETSVVMAGKFVLDVEQNLGQELAGIRKAPVGTPSGWWCNDFLSTDSPTKAIYSSSPSSNQIRFPGLTALVNGWVIPVSYTGYNGASNLLDLGAPPTGVGEKRWDLVILEVWRKLLTAAGTPTGTSGKSGGGRIWRNGNVKVPAANDATLNWADDILNTNVGEETSKRVQIQYRLRVIQGVDLASYSRGMSDPTVVANTVPAAPASPDGVPSSFGYAAQTSFDSGLWVAGDGDPTNSLGTVDGYMYAVPLMAVSRRNTAAFDRITNQNGGSGRPDGYTATQILATDLLDLRSGVSPSGWDYRELGEKTFQRLLDNTLKTEFGSTTLGGGTQGSTLFTAVEVGVSTANGGDGVTTGDTPGADFIGEFDGVRRVFSDRPVLETCWVRLTPADAAGSPTDWPDFSDFTITLNPATLQVYRQPTTAWASYLPVGTIILDVLDAYWDPHGVNLGNILRTPAIIGVSGVGSVPAGPVTLVAYNTGSYTTADLLVKIVVAYPSGQGLTRTPDTACLPVWNNPAALPADFAALENSSTDPAHREVRLDYHTTTVTETFWYSSDPVFPSEFSDVAVESYLTLYERMRTSTVSVTVNGVAAPDVWQASPYTLSFPSGLSLYDEVVVTYQAVRAIPQTGAQITLYYTAAAPQTVRSSVAGTVQSVILRWVSPTLYCLANGTGGDAEAYPYPLQSTQTGGVYPNSAGHAAGTYTGDHLLNGSRVDFIGFGADTGFAQVPATIPMAATSGGLTVQRVAGDVDAEGRTFYKSIVGSYLPSAMGASLSYTIPHRVVLPMLVELPADSTLGPKGQLLLLTMQRWCPADTQNSVQFDSNLLHNFTSASIYRLKGNLLNNRDGV